MSNERAIEILREMKAGLKISLHDKYADFEEKQWANETDEACDLAIQALIQRKVG